MSLPPPPQDSHHRVYLSTLLILALVGCYRAQDFNVTINVGVNDTIAIVPDEVDYIIIEASTPINLRNLTSNATNQTLLQSDVICDTIQCSVNLMGKLTDSVVTLDLIFTTEEGNNLVLSITIRKDLNYSCVQYPIPRTFIAMTIMDYNFTCQPFTSTNRIVRWRRFREYDDLISFQQTGTGFNNAIIYGGDNYTLDGNINQTLTVSSISQRTVPVDVAYYFVPSFVVDGSDVEEVTAETGLYVTPTITTRRRIFSIDVIFGDRDIFTDIRCETVSFPPATVKWILVSPDFPGSGQDLATINNTRFRLIDTGVVSSINLTLDALVNITDLQYSDDGNFTCTASNNLGSSSQFYILRVKSRLRPLWPAIGIVGVILLTIVLMLVSFTIEKIVEKKKTHNKKNSNPSSPDHTDQRFGSISSTGATYNSSKRGSNPHSAVKRLSSAKPLLDESTL